MNGQAYENRGQIIELRDLRWSENLFVLVVAGFVLGVVYYFAWLSEDCFITLRYVSNTIHGYGAVFNVGERVQGYTHPLWFVLLLTGSLVFGDPMRVAYGLSFLFTLVTVIIVGRGILRVAPSFVAGAILLCTTAAVYCLSDPWVSFQSGGLENSLAHLLIVLIVWEVWIRQASAPGRLMLLLGLLCLTRPDFTVWVAPLAILLLARVRSLRQMVVLILAGVPVVAWLLFAAIYYHDVLPNTYYAKVGIYSSVWDAIARGANYLGDWLYYDVLAGCATFLFLGVAAWKARSAPRIALMIGMILYVGWVIEVGGDFMRGRLFVSVFTAAIFAGSLALAEQLRTPSLRLDAELAGVGFALLMLLFAWLVISEPVLDPMNLDVVNERMFYPGYSLKYWLANGRLEHPAIDLSEAELLRKSASKCGPITIHMFTPGTIGYFAGPQVSVIDLLGLTDRFIAHLPRESLASSSPRAGHALKKIPLAYLVSRKDIKLLPNWMESLENGDCDWDSKFAKLEPPGDRTVVHP